jgi:alpha-tubulin suppressor-like RCC1 family protein
MYSTGLKMNYTPKQYNFDPKFLDINDVRLIGCGRKHYMIVTNDNNIVVWGNVFKEKPEDVSHYSEGFSHYFGDSLFDGGQIKSLEVKNSIFGALI